jgi:hypothetical protein
MKLVMKTLIAAAVAVCGTQANALQFTIGTAPGFYTAFATSQLDPGYIFTSAQIGSAANQWLAPAGIGDTPYMVVSTDGSTAGTAAISFSNALNSYSFLWGSPDDFNTVTFGLTNNTTVVYTGAELGLLGHFTADGSNVNTSWFTASIVPTVSSGEPAARIASVTFASTGVAFEVANVTPIPEPATYALMLAGLGAIGIISRRRKA